MMTNSELTQTSNSDKLEQLRALGLNQQTTVWTRDGRQLGEAVSLHHRQQDINPELRLYATYLEVTRPEMGNTAFIPTDFISGFSQSENRLMLSVPFSVVEEETWERRPDFIARGQQHEEELSAA